LSIYNNIKARGYLTLKMQSHQSPDPETIPQALPVLALAAKTGAHRAKPHPARLHAIRKFWPKAKTPKTKTRDENWRNEK
jgi:hypothetical protein